MTTQLFFYIKFLFMLTCIIYSVYIWGLRFDINQGSVWLWTQFSKRTNLTFTQHVASSDIPSFPCCFFSKLNCYYNCYCIYYCNYFGNCYCNHYWNYYCNCNHDRHNLRLWVGLCFLLSFKLCSGTRNNPHQNHNPRHCHF